MVRSKLPDKALQIPKLGRQDRECNDDPAVLIQKGSRGGSKFFRRPGQSDRPFRQVGIAIESARKSIEGVTVQPMIVKKEGRPRP